MTIFSFASGSSMACPGTIADHVFVEYFGILFIIIFCFEFFKKTIKIFFAFITEYFGALSNRGPTVSVQSTGTDKICLISVI